MKHVTSANISIIILSLLTLASCSNHVNIKEADYIDIAPLYDSVKITETTDTITFSLDDSTYNSLESITCFTSSGRTYISFYDKQSKSLNIYDFENQLLKKRISIKKILHYGFLYKTLAYAKNFDSILILNRDQLIITDSSGIIRQQMSYILNENNVRFAFLGNDNPPVFVNNKLFLGVKTSVKETSRKELERWKNLYCFDIANSNSDLFYNFPLELRNKFYGRRLITPSYCLNNRGNFVFSFSGDIRIYETNLSNYHKAYFAASQYQQAEINPVSEKELSSDQGFKNYLLRDSYGSLYFDSYRKLYLRVSRRKITPEEYTQKKYKKKQSLIILNDEFKIIGESNINSDILLNTIFFTQQGEIYARVSSKNEYKISFIKLKYNNQ